MRLLNGSLVGPCGPSATVSYEREIRHEKGRPQVALAYLHGYNLLMERHAALYF